MNKLFFLLVFVFCFHFSDAQIFKGKEAAQIIPEADLIRKKEFTEVPVYVRFRESIELNNDKALRIISGFTSSETGFILKNIQKNSSDGHTYRYTQTFGNYPIEFSAWLIHSENGRVYAMNGELLGKPQAELVFSISETQAFETAKKFMNSNMFMWEDENEEKLLKQFTGNANATYYPKAEKVLAPSEIILDKSVLRTAYKFNMYSKFPHDRKNVYVDALSGEVLYSIQLLTSGYEEGNANTAYSGNQEITTEFHNSTYRLRDGTRGNGIETFDCQDTGNFNNAIDFTNSNNTWDTDKYYATDAHFATAATYDYFYEVHGRNSIDGNGHALHSYVHFNLIDYGMSSNVNAFWNGQWMTYGDGNPDNGITALTTVDICAHEITHGLTTYTSSLNYLNESGALNEAFSDIFGAAVEFWAVPEYADWTIGEDIGYIIRSMENPKSRFKPDTYLGQYWVFGPEDYGGVHTNNGPLCYWFYLLSEGGSGTNDNGDTYSVSPIGIEKAEQIAFKMQTVYLTYNSDYRDAWFYGMQAAADFFGPCSIEVQEVGNAFYAIGVADPYENVVHADFTTQFSQNCMPPLEVKFLNQSYNAESFEWDFGDGNFSTEVNPVHTYTEYGDFDVKLTVNGGICGNEEIIKENFVSINPEHPCITLMPLFGNSVVESCAGFIYDHGGPNNNYYDNINSSITLSSPDAAHYIIFINHFDIEAGSGASCNYDYLAFYDGPNMTAALINDTRYCNTTGNPGVIYSTGNSITIQFYTDQGMNLSGFEIEYYCISENDAPIALFSCSETYSCTGQIEFTDASLNSPTEWLWDFGDGNTSSEQHPIHIYTDNGLYDISLTVTNANGSHTNTKYDLIRIDLPVNSITEQNYFGCSDESFELNISIDGEAFWFYEINDEVAFHAGNTLVHEPIENDLQYWIKEKVSGESFSFGATNNTQGGGFFGHPDHIHYLIFDAYTDFRLNTVKVNAETNGVRTIALRNSSNQIITQKNVFIQTGVSVIELNLDIPAGENLQLAGLGSPNLFRTNTSAYLNYPYTIENVASIKHSSAGTDPTGYYYYFYDWDITTTDCMSEPIQINITANDCLNTVIEKYTQKINIFPNPNNGVFNIEIPSQQDIISINIHDLNGREVYYSYKNNSKKNIIEVKINEASGVYILKVIDNEKISTSRIIITQ